MKWLKNDRNDEKAGEVKAGRMSFGHEIYGYWGRGR